MGEGVSLFQPAASITLRAQQGTLCEFAKKIASF